MITLDTGNLFILYDVCIINVMIIKNYQLLYLYSFNIDLDNHGNSHLKYIKLYNDILN